MKKDELIKSQQVDHINNEYRILSITNHPFIVIVPFKQINFDGIGQTSKHLYMFMEFIPGGELFTHLREEGMFEPHKAAYLFFYLDFMLLKSFPFSSISTAKISSTAT